jgi:uncharacterized membrane protein YqhA
MSTLLVTLGIFLLITFLYWLGAFVALYHLIRFGVGTLPKKLAFIFFLGSIGLYFVATLFYIISIPAIFRFQLPDTSTFTMPSITLKDLAQPK